MNVKEMIGKYLFFTIDQGQVYELVSGMVSSAVGNNLVVSTDYGKKEIEMDKIVGIIENREF